MGKNGKRPTTADTLVADEDMEGPWVLVALLSSIPQARGRKPISQPDAINLNLEH